MPRTRRTYKSQVFIHLKQAAERWRIGDKTYKQCVTKFVNAYNLYARSKVGWNYLTWKEGEKMMHNYANGM